MKYTIYALCEPNTEFVRYVGITRQRLSDRVWQHRKEAERHTGDTHRERWLRKLAREGLKPVALVLEVTEDPIRERFWIFHFREQGHKLVNSSNGCDGLSRLDAESRQMLLDSGGYLAHSEEVKQKIANSSRERWLDPSYKEKVGARIKEALLNRERTPEEIEKHRQVHLGKKHRLGHTNSPEHRAKISEAQKGKVISEATREKLKNRLADPETKAIHKQRCQERSSSPDYREKLSKASKQNFQDPERLERHRQMCRERSADPAYRQKLKDAWKTRPRPTHCKHGHSLNDAYILGNGQRRCKECCHQAYKNRKPVGHLDG